MTTFLIKPAVKVDIVVKPNPKVKKRRIDKISSFKILWKDPSDIEYFCQKYMKNKILPDLHHKVDWFYRTHVVLELLQLTSIPKCPCCGSYIDLCFSPDSNSMKTKFGGFENYCSISCSESKIKHTKHTEKFLNVCSSNSSIEVFSFIKNIITRNKTNSITSISNFLGVSEQRMKEIIKKNGLHSLFNNNRCEVHLIDFIRSLGEFKVIHCDRSILGDLREIDIYLPDNKIAFEHNGSYWHSPKMFIDIPHWIDYHNSKVEICKRKGIHLIHLWEGYLNHEDIIRSALFDGVYENVDMSEILDKMYGIK